MTVSSGNSRVRKGGYVGQDVTFDLSKAKIVAADSDGVAGVSAADVKAGDKVLVQARLPRGTKAPAPAAPEAPAEAAASEEPVGRRGPGRDRGPQARRPVAPRGGHRGGAARPVSKLEGDDPAARLCAGRRAF